MEIVSSGNFNQPLDLKSHINLTQLLTEHAMDPNKEPPLNVEEVIRTIEQLENNLDNWLKYRTLLISSIQASLSNFPYTATPEEFEKTEENSAQVRRRLRDEKLFPVAKYCAKQLIEKSYQYDIDPGKAITYGCRLLHKEIGPAVAYTLVTAAFGQEVCDVAGLDREKYRNDPEIRVYTEGNQSGYLYYDLSQSSAFGRYLTPLVKKLTALPKEQQVENIATLACILSHFREYGLPKVSLERSDIMYLLTNPIGLLLRRPVLDGAFIQFVGDKIFGERGEIHDEGTERIRNIFLDPISASMWSQYALKNEIQEWISREDALPDEKAVYVDLDEKIRDLKILFAANPIYFGKLISQSLTEGSKFTDQCSDAIETVKTELFYIPVDLGHALNILGPLQTYHTYYETSVNKKSLPALTREAKLMLIEDNIGYALLLDSLLTSKGVLPYSPYEEATNDQRQQMREQKGHYTSADRAFDVIKANFENGIPLPELVLTDIELPDSMDGLTFVEKLHEFCSANKVNPPHVILVHSSHPLKYQSITQRLKTNGLITDFFDKVTVTPEWIIERFNEVFSKLDL